MPDRGQYPHSSFVVAKGVEALPERLRGAVAAIGNFDGVHRGHRDLLEATLAQARAAGAPALAITFEPHPRTVFRPEEPVFRLTPPLAKEALLRALGFDGVVVIPFDRTFAARSAESFVEEILCAGLGVRGVVIGYNFHFGKDRRGTPQFLEEAGARLGFAVSVMPPVADRVGEAYSSYRIRKALEAGDVEGANQMLGYRWFVLGEVVPGDQRGRDLGFPTANIRLGADCRLRHGIYAVRFRRPGGTVHDGVASFGRRPTFDNGPPLLEVFVMDFKGSLYGELVEVAFVAWIRPELRFDSAEALVARMHEDVEAARAALAAAGPEALFALRG
jgi:riboflavin kinase/FMN adenylyltransferase